MQNGQKRLLRRLRNGEKKTMGRLTFRGANGVPFISAKDRGNDINIYGQFADKLAAYEDIIDEPEKLKIVDKLYLEKCEEVNRLKEELAEKEEEFCEWEIWDEEANCYHTSCENAHFFVDGSPKDNKHVFCPYCGRKINEV